MKILTRMFLALASVIGGATGVEALVFNMAHPEMTQAAVYLLHWPGFGVSAAFLALAALANLFVKEEKLDSTT